MHMFNEQVLENL